MMRIIAVRSSTQHTAFTCMIRGCWSMWVRLNRLDCSAVVRNTGSTTWGARSHWCGPDIVESSGTSAVRHLPQPDVLGGHAGGVRSGAVSVGSGADCGASSSCSTGGALHGGHGTVASTQYAGDLWPPAVVVVQRVHVLC